MRDAPSDHAHPRTASPPSPVERGDPRRWYALGLLCVAGFMVIVDASIVIIAIPSIETGLGLSPSGVQWVFSAYALTFGGLLLLGGRAADLFGRRRVFMVGVALFALSSLMCGLAWSGAALIAARAVQGVCAAVMTPTALSILMTTFQEGAERNKALGIWGAMGGIGGTAGAVLGGLVTGGMGWEWIFFINVPVGLVIVALSPVLLRESRAGGGGRGVDLPGALTITAALVLLVYAVVEAPDAGWTGVQTLGLLLASAVLVALFIAIEARSAAPMVPLRILRSRALLGGNAIILLIGMAVYGMNVVVTEYGQRVLGYRPVEFGLMTSVLALSAVVGSYLGQHVVTRIGVRPIAVGGTLLTAVGCTVLTQVSPTGSYLGDILAGLVIFGPGLGAGTVAASIAALSGVAERESGMASGLTTMAFQIGGALGIAVMTTVAVSRTAHAHMAGAVALTEGYRAAFGVAIVFSLLGFAAALLLLGGRRTMTH